MCFFGAEQLWDQVGQKPVNTLWIFASIFTYIIMLTMTSSNTTYFFPICDNILICWFHVALLEPQGPCWWEVIGSDTFIAFPVLKKGHWIFSTNATLVVGLLSVEIQSMTHHNKLSLLTSLLMFLLAVIYSSGSSSFWS